MPSENNALLQFPKDSTVSRIGLVPPHTNHLQVGKGDSPFGTVLEEQATLPQNALGEVRVLAIPFDTLSNSDQASHYFQMMNQWVADVHSSDMVAQPMTFQGVQLIWSPTRIAIMASAERLPAIRATLLEFTAYETELRQLENQLQTAWPDLEADAALAFEFGAKTMRKKETLRKRFLETMLLSAKLARIGPYIYAPHFYPPTLASQLSERLRDRLRQMHRHEFLCDQLEVFESIYEQAGQRASDYAHTRTGNILECIIIILLVAQLMLGLMEVLTK
ncbi:MAG: hypothetical protein R3B84_00815 [Zavarzinella sp.]